MKEVLLALIALSLFIAASGMDYDDAIKMESITNVSK